MPGRLVTTIAADETDPGPVEAASDGIVDVVT
jgi:hypothetical protein